MNDRFDASEPAHPHARARPPEDTWHVFAARHLGRVTGWARRELGRAGRKLSEAAAATTAAARAPSEGEAAAVGPLLDRLGQLVTQADGEVDRLGDDPAFWLIVERLAMLRPRSLQRTKDRAPLEHTTSAEDERDEHDG